MEEYLKFTKSVICSRLYNNLVVKTVIEASYFLVLSLPIKSHQIYIYILKLGKM